MSDFLPKLRELIATDRLAAGWLLLTAEAIADLVEALQGEVDNCANCQGAGEFEMNLRQHKCDRCARSRSVLSKLNGEQT